MGRHSGRRLDVAVGPPVLPTRRRRAGSLIDKTPMNIPVAAFSDATLARAILGGFRRTCATRVRRMRAERPLREHCGADGADSNWT